MKAFVQQGVSGKLVIRPRAQFPYGCLAPKPSEDSGTSPSVKWWCLRVLVPPLIEANFVVSWENGGDVQVAVSSPTVAHTVLILVMLVKSFSKLGYGG